MTSLKDPFIIELEAYDKVYFGLNRQAKLRAKFLLASKGFAGTN